MNERIKLLKQQAEAYTAEFGIDNSLYGQALINVLDQKFAELIVQECIAVLDREVYLATREDGEQAYIDVILLEHFGVDE